MAQTIRVMPRGGRLVRNHDRGFRPLAKDGEEVPDSIEWRRKIARGDVEIVAAESAPPAQKTLKSKA